MLFIIILLKHVGVHENNTEHEQCQCDDEDDGVNIELKCV